MKHKIFVSIFDRLKKLRLPRASSILTFVKNRKKFLGIFAAIILLSGVGFYFFAPKAGAAWWNDAWLYRKPIQIANASGGVLTDYQVKILDNKDLSADITAGKVLASLNDLRFTNQNGDLLPYWIEDSTGTSVDVWLKYPSVPTGGAVVYMYYGNPSAAVYSDGNKVFELFDDFSGTSVDASKWTKGTIAATSGTDFSVSGGNLVGGNNNRYLQSVRTFTGNYSAETRMYTTTPPVNGFMTTGFFTSAANNFGVLDHNGESYYKNDGNAWVSFAYNGTGQWNRDTASVVGTTASYSRFGSVTLLTMSGTSITNSGISGENVRIGSRYDGNSYDQNYSAQWDWIFVRKTSATEPVAATPATEENGPGPAAYWKFDEGTGTTGYDSSGQGRNATLTSMAAPATAASGWQSEDKCVSGKCLGFDGTDDTVSYAANDITLLKGQVTTVSAWFNLRGFGPNGLAEIYSASGNSSLTILKVTPNSVGLAITGDPYNTVVSTGTISLNTWHQVEAIIDRTSGIFYVYLDGQYKGQDTIAAYSPVSNVASSGGKTGTGNSGDYLKGYMDEVVLYPYARTADQIKTDFNNRGANNGSVANLSYNAQNSTLTNGLMGYWKMDESIWSAAGDVKDATGNNNGTASATGVAIGAGKFGNAGVFDGDNHYVSVTNPANGSLDVGTGDFSLSIWYKGGDMTNERFLQKYVNVTTVQGYMFYYGGLTIGNGTTALNTTAYTVPNPTEWNHYVAVVDRTAGKARVYVNGVLKTENTFNISGSFTNTSNFYIAAGYGSIANHSLDEARMYNRALSPAEVQELYDFAPAPVAHWKLDDDSGTSAKDSSGSGNTGTLTNGPTWTPGKVGSSLNFDGTDDYVNFGTLGNFGIGRGSGLSTSFWVKQDRNDQPLSVFGEMDNASTGRNGLTVRLNMAPNTSTLAGSIRVGLVSDEVTPKVLSGATNANSVAVGVWTHIAIAVQPDSNKIFIYVNGVPQAVTYDRQETPAIFANFANFMSLGADNSAGTLGRYFDGQIDDVRVYNYARSQKKILEDMNAGGPATKSPVAYWKFDEGSGTVVHDLSGNNNVITTAANRWSNAGKFGKAIDLPGAGYVTAADSDSLDFGTSDFSVSFWGYTRDYTNPKSLVAMQKGNQAYAAGNYPGWEFGNSFSANGYFFAINDGTNRANGTITMDAGYKPADIQNKWTHFAFVVSRATGKVNLYVNNVKQSGVLDISAVTGSINNALGFKIANINGWLLDGLFDEVKIYNFAMNEDDIRGDYNQGKVTMSSAAGIEAGGGTSNSAAREYCPPGNIEGNCASGQNPSPVGEWKFDEKSGTSVADSSGNGNNGTLYNTPIWTAGKFGSALNFNGSTSYVDLGNAASVQLTTGTIGAWIKTTDAGVNFRAIADKSSAYSLFLSNNVFGIYDWGGAAFRSSGIALNDGKWHFVACSFQSGVANGTILYIDGKSVTTTTMTVTNQVSSLQIGVNTGTQQFAGAIDQVRVYSYVRTPAQIAYDYNRGGPTGWWKMDECQGNTIYDASGFGNNGTLTVAATGTQTSAGTCTDGASTSAWNNGKIGKFGSSLNFDGTDDAVLISNSNVIGTASNFSITAWVKTTRAGLSTIYGEFDASGNSTRNYLLITAAGQITLDQYPGDGTQLVSNRAVNDGNWHHIAYTRNGVNRAVYVDGVLDNSDAVAENYTGGAPTETRIGYRGATHTSWLFQGQIDDLRTYNYSLTAQQVANIRNEGSALRFGPNTGGQ
jgi:hypothetical protein